MIRFAVIGSAATIHDYVAASRRLRGSSVVAQALLAGEDGASPRTAPQASDPVLYASVPELVGRAASSFDAMILEVAAPPPSELAAAARTAAATGTKVFIVGPSVAAEKDFLELTGEPAAGGGSAPRGAVRLFNPLRYLPSVLTVKQALDSGNLGDLGLTRLHHWRPADPRASQPADRPPTDVGARHWICGELDLVAWLFRSTPETILVSRTKSAVESQPRNEYVQVHLGFPNGGMAVIDVGEVTTRDGYFSLSTIGSRGAAYADGHHDSQLLFRETRASALRTGEFAPDRYVMLREFLKWASDPPAGPTPSASSATTGSLAANLPAILEAVEQSLASGGPVALTARPHGTT